MRKAILLLMTTVLLAACDSEPKNVSEGRELYQLYFQKTLRDPESLKIYSEKYEVDGDGIKVSWTIDYGAKNGYGAMDRETKEFMTIGDMLFVDNHYISKERLQQ